MDKLTFEIVRNDGRFGPGRMDWLLTCNGQLVSHCGAPYVLEAKLTRLQAEAWERVNA